MKTDFATEFPLSVDLWRRARIEGTDDDLFVTSEEVIGHLCCFVESRLNQKILDLVIHQVRKNEDREQKVFAFSCFGFRVHLRSGASILDKKAWFYNLHLHLFHPLNRVACSASASYELEGYKFEPKEGYFVSYDGSAALFGLMERLSDSEHSFS